MAISLFKTYFVGHFSYHRNGKSKIKAGILHLGYSLLNQLNEINETQLSVFGSRGGQICPLMHVALWHRCIPSSDWLIISSLLVKFDYMKRVCN